MSEVAEVTSESPRAGDKTSDMKISATKGLDSKIFEKQEDAEEEKGEHDPEVTPAEPEVLKKPSARAVPAAAAAKKTRLQTQSTCDPVDCQKRLMES